jgi:hypothetical protein
MINIRTAQMPANGTTDNRRTRRPPRRRIGLGAWALTLLVILSFAFILIPGGIVPVPLVLALAAGMAGDESWTPLHILSYGGCASLLLALALPRRPHGLASLGGLACLVTIWCLISGVGRGFEPLMLMVSAPFILFAALKLIECVLKIAVPEGAADSD